MKEGCAWIAADRPTRATNHRPGAQHRAKFPRIGPKREDDWHIREYDCAEIDLFCVAIVLTCFVLLDACAKTGKKTQ
jgi:hypothetical protein